MFSLGITSKKSSKSNKKPANEHCSMTYVAEEQSPEDRRERKPVLKVFPSRKLLEAIKGIKKFGVFMWDENLKEIAFSEWQKGDGESYKLRHYMHEEPHLIFPLSRKDFEVTIVNDSRSPKGICESHRVEIFNGRTFYVIKVLHHIQISRTGAQVLALKSGEMK